MRGIRAAKHGFPLLGGGADSNTMVLKTFNTLCVATAVSAEAGTPYFGTLGLRVGRRPALRGD
jgi:hypothetical protein